MIEFAQYAKIKNNYCMCYFGYSDEYLVQLRLIKPILQKQFPGLNLCFGCKDDKCHLLDGCDPILSLSRIKIDRNNFGHIRELTYNGQTHPIEDLLRESGIVHSRIPRNIQARTSNLAVLITKGNHPTRSLEHTQSEQLRSWLIGEGFEVVSDRLIPGASLVAGVESVPLFEAAAQGIRTVLVPTGLGTRLYQTLFPDAEVWNGTCLYKRP